MHNYALSIRCIHYTKKPYPNFVPDGVDFEKAKELGLHVIWALSLPGKVAPVTSGIIIKETISNMISEMEV